MEINLRDLRGENIRSHEIDISKLIGMPVHEFERLSKEERAVCNLALRNYCRALKRNYNPKVTLVQKAISAHGHFLRNFDLNCNNTPGASNIPDTGCIIVPNHSNSHDAFIIAEVLEKNKCITLPDDSHSIDSDITERYVSVLDRLERDLLELKHDYSEKVMAKNGHPSTFLAALEGLSPLEKKLFELAHSTMIDRRDKESCNYGLIDFAGKIAQNDTGIIFGECTWNMHPYDAMLPIKIGPVKTAAITGKPIIPTIMEYVEVPKFVRCEKDLYSECAVVFGNPIFISPEESLIEQTVMLQKKMEELRKAVWKWKNIDKSVEGVDPEVYVNHTWLKKFGTGVIKFDSEQEIDLVRGHVNEYCLKNGEFCPGSVPEDYYVKKKTPFNGITIIGKNSGRV